ncbi:hypothetical protein MP228_009050 [Amoeboaphelidium protococcarum]|nr:hypothetical protein MP228_009050 [Amoeboaphelidium protococcarum]
MFDTLILPIDPTEQQLRQSKSILIALHLSKRPFKIGNVQLPQYPSPTLVLHQGGIVLFDYVAILRNLLDVDPCDFQLTQALSLVLSGAGSEYKHPLIEILIKPEQVVPEVQLKSIDETIKAHTDISSMRKLAQPEYNPKKNLVLPVAGEKNILITSALPYVNNVPHLGNLIGCVLSADVFARYSRLRGWNTCYVCGTDEYGTTTEVKALEEGVSCQELCDKFHALHKQVYDAFEIDFDYFGRTTTQKHSDISQDIFKQIHANSQVESDTMVQLYCDNDNRFLSDRYVIGQCPLCGYADARGDQCDGCGKLLNATELINPHCKTCNSTPVLRDSKHLFLKLPELQDQIQKFCSESSQSGQWTVNGIQITENWLKDPLKNRCITRDLKWGTPVPLKDYEGKVFYVWFDAPIGYISITANYTDQYLKWWQQSSADQNLDVKLYQFMGKDNVPFHTVIFPGILLGTKQPWTMLHHLNTTEYLNYEGDKFSKSRGVGVFGTDVIGLDIPISVFRYYLLSIRPETNDSSFSWSELAMRSNGELLANLGNFVNRTLKFIQAKCGSIVPSLDKGCLSVAEFDKLLSGVATLLKEYHQCMELSKQRQALRCIMDISHHGNTFLQEVKLDNTLMLTDKKKADSALHVAVNLIYLIAMLCYPFMPSVNADLLKQLNATCIMIPISFEFNLLAGHRIGTPFPLFKRVDDALIKQLQQKFGGVDSSSNYASGEGAAKSKAKGKDQKQAKQKSEKSQAASKN